MHVPVMDLVGFQIRARAKGTLNPVTADASVIFKWTGPLAARNQCV
jgi:hypothetical protein